MKKCEFQKEEFFSNHENYKIKTLCELNKELENEKLINETNEDYTKKEKYLDLPDLSEGGNESAKIIMNTLDNIREDLEKGKIIKKDLEKFLNIKRIQKRQNNKEEVNEKPGEINTNSEKKDYKEEKQKEIDKNKKEKLKKN